MTGLRLHSIGLLPFLSQPHFPAHATWIQLLNKVLELDPCLRIGPTQDMQHVSQTIKRHPVRIFTKAANVAMAVGCWLNRMLTVVYQGI